MNTNPGAACNLKQIDPLLLMTREEGTAWHEFKATLGPIYPGYESFDIYMNWLKEKLTIYGCVDFLEHHWEHETYRVDDWPNHESGALKLVSDGTEIPVGTFLMFSKPTGEDGLTAPMMYYDPARGTPEKGAFKDKIVVMGTLPHPEKPYPKDYLESYVITDTNYRSDPEPSAEMLESPDPAINNSWHTRWEFSQWFFTLAKYAKAGEAAGLIIVSNLTYGALKGLYDRQDRQSYPALVLDRVNGQQVLEDARNGKMATMTLVGQFFKADAWNYVCFLPGTNYGTAEDEYISINTHVDAMSLTQDNGSLGALGIVRYFSNIPQTERKKTLLLCVDSRHFIEGFEHGNIAHDPYVVFPELKKKITVTVGLEHMGEMEGAEDYANNTMVPTGRPEYTFMKCDDNDYCARILIQAAIRSGLQRADVKVDGRPGIHGLFKGKVRAVQASVHRLDVCVIGQAGNWCGAHTQTFSGMQYFGADKFYQEVWLWTQIVSDMMATDAIVYHIVWSDINTAIRSLAAKSKISIDAMLGLLGSISSIFELVEAGSYAISAKRLEKEFIPAVRRLVMDIDDLTGVLTLADKAIAGLTT